MVEIWNKKFILCKTNLFEKEITIKYLIFISNTFILLQFGNNNFYIAIILCNIYKFV